MRALPWFVVLLVGCGGPAASPTVPSGQECRAMPSVASTAGSSSAAASGSASVSVAPALATAVPTEAQALARLFGKSPVEASWFAPSFLAKVPPEKIDAILLEMRKSLGAFVGATPVSEHKLTSKFDHGTVETMVKLDEIGRFTTLFFRPPELEKISLEDAVKAIQALPGRKSLVVVTDGKERAAVDADVPLAVGSTFKLAVLAALRAQIDGKKRAWKDVVELRPEWRSLPSGILQDWPDRSALTLQTLASLMISKSDNTASDALVDLVGRKAIEALSPHARPFLTTREMFVLKWGNHDGLERFRKGDEVTRRAVLAELAGKALPKAEAVGDKPRAIDVEWYFSAREACALMEKVHDLPLMGINPGVAKVSEWQRVAYKGGSEPGVLDLTTHLTEKGHTHCVSVAWNDPDKELAETRLFGLYGQLLTALRTP